jgi:hypothetical protein
MKRLGVCVILALAALAQVPVPCNPWNPSEEPGHCPRTFKHVRVASYESLVAPWSEGGTITLSATSGGCFEVVDIDQANPGNNDKFGTRGWELSASGAGDMLLEFSEDTTDIVVLTGAFVYDDHRPCLTCEQDETSSPVTVCSFDGVGPGEGAAHYNELQIRAADWGLDHLAWCRLIPCGFEGFAVVVQCSEIPPEYPEPPEGPQ